MAGAFGSTAFFHRNNTNTTTATVNPSNITIGGNNVTSDVFVEGDNISNTANPQNTVTAMNVNNNDNTVTNDANSVNVPVTTT